MAVWLMINTKTPHNSVPMPLCFWSAANGLHPESELTVQTLTKEKYIYWEKPNTLQLIYWPRTNSSSMAIWAVTLITGAEHIYTSPRCFLSFSLWGLKRFKSQVIDLSHDSWPPSSLLNTYVATQAWMDVTWKFLQFKQSSKIAHVALMYQAGIVGYNVEL